MHKRHGFELTAAPRYLRPGYIVDRGELLLEPSYSRPGWKYNSHGRRSKKSLRGWRGVHELLRAVQRAREYRLFSGSSI
jgi:hypothetical protein